MPADTILYNARIATNGVPSFVEAVAVTDGKIIAIGSDHEIFRLRGPNTKTIDASGRTVIPGRTRFGPDSATTWNCDGTECLRSRTRYGCSRTRPRGRRRHSGCG